MATIDKINVNGTEYELTGSDTKVKQSPVSTDANYELLLSNSASNTEETNKVGKDSGAIYNPSKKSVTFGSRAGTTGSYSQAEGLSVTASGTYSHAEGAYTTASNTYTHAEGDHSIASGSSCSHAEGRYATASGSYGSHAEGNYTTASADCSHAEGTITTASGDYSHAEGSNTTAQRRSQHVFGEYNKLDTGGTNRTTRGDYVEIVGNGTSSARSNARTLDWDGNETLAGSLTASTTLTIGSRKANQTIGTNSYAQGYNVTASGNYSHAEGGDTTASGSYSHAEGYNTTAQRAYQHVFGKYNIVDTEGADGTKEGEYIEIVGNGAWYSDDDIIRSNARTLDWDGNEWLAGGLTTNGDVIIKSNNSTGSGLSTTDCLTYDSSYNKLKLKSTTDTNDQDYILLDPNSENSTTIELCGHDSQHNYSLTTITPYDIIFSTNQSGSAKSLKNDMLPITGSNSNYSWIKFPTSKYAIIWGRKTATYTGRGNTQSITLNNYPFTLTNPVAQVTGNLAGIVDTQVLYVNTTGTSAEVYVRGSTSSNVTATLYVTVCGTYS